MQIYSYLPQDNTVRLVMAFCNRVLPRSVVSGMLRKLRETIEHFSRNLHAPLLLPLASPALPCRCIPMAMEEVVIIPDQYCPSPRPEAFSFTLIDPHMFVERVWEAFKERSKINRSVETVITLDTSYYEI